MTLDLPSGGLSNFFLVKPRFYFPVWGEVRNHLEDHGFKVKLRGSMPSFDDHGEALLINGRSKKRGNTGMIFVASRKGGEAGPSLQRTCVVFLDDFGAKPARFRSMNAFF